MDFGLTALLEIDGKPIIERLRDTLAPMFDEILVRADTSGA